MELTFTLVRSDPAVLLAYGLATWRISNMLVSERGPFDLVVRLRERFGVKHSDGVPIMYPDGSLFECLWCMSVWVGLALLVVPWAALLPFAASAFAILIMGALG